MSFRLFPRHFAFDKLRYRNFSLIGVDRHEILDFLVFCKIWHQDDPLA